MQQFHQIVEACKSSPVRQTAADIGAAMVDQSKTNASGAGPAPDWQLS